MRVSLAMLIFIACETAQAQDKRVVNIGRMDAARNFTMLEGDVSIVPEGPDQARVSRFDDKFSLRIDLGPSGVKLTEFDLLKLDVKSDAHGFMVVSLENYPRPGDLSHWYVLDSARVELPWHTISIDLNRPEEVVPVGKFKGMESVDPQARGLRIRGHVTDIRRSIQGSGRSLWLGNLRLVRRTIDLDWDQSQAPYSWGDGQDLVFKYPLTLTNRTDEPVSATVRLSPIEAKSAQSAISREKVELKPRETKAIEARISLPAQVARNAAPLYCERFRAIAQVAGLADSEVSILRSSDEIPLSVTVPFTEDQLQFPLLPRVRNIPDSVTGFNSRARAAAIQLAAQATPDDLVEAIDPPLGPLTGLKGLFVDRQKDTPSGQADLRYRNGLTACAFLYDQGGDRVYLAKGTQLLLKAAELFPEMAAEWRKAPGSPISHGILTPAMLRLGWITGSMRWPYSYDRHGMFNDFDLLAKDMEPGARERIIKDFIVPAAVQMRNHYFGLNNQQDVVNYPVLYAGLAARNWPLVSHAWNSSHGILNQLRYNFDDDGLAGEGNYHKPAIEPILCAAELLLPRGIDLYDERLHSILHSQGAALIRKEYNSPMRAYADQHRFTGKDVKLAGKDAKREKAIEGVHLTTGVTQLRSGSSQVAMNWGSQINRNAPDRCALQIGELGGGNYSHSSLGQSILIVDESRQNPVPAKVLGYHLNGPVQYVCAESDQHYPGSTITRTFALIGKGVLVLDRVTSDHPRTVDWCFKGAGSRVSLELQEFPGGFTEKPDDPTSDVLYGSKLKFNKHFKAATNDAWSDDGVRLTMAASNGTQVYRFHVPAPFSSSKKQLQAGVPVLMVRRSDVQQTDFVAYFSDQTKSLEQTPVLGADGKEANALGATVVLKSGQTIRSLVNFEPGTEVHLGKLTTKERFASDYRE